MKQRRVEELWNHAFAATLKDASPLQVREMKKAFYAGASEMLHFANTIGVVLTLERASVVLDEIHAELEEFLSSDRDHNM